MPKGRFKQKQLRKSKVMTLRLDDSDHEELQWLADLIAQEYSRGVSKSYVLTKCYELGKERFMKKYNIKREL